MEGDYTKFSQKDLTRENLTNNFQFIEDASNFLADREDYYSDDVDDIYDRYLEHFRYQNVNEVTAVRDMYQAQSYKQKGDVDGLARMGRLMDTFDKQDSEINFETMTDYLGGVFTAPTTYGSLFSFGAAKGGALAAQQGLKFGIKEIIKNGAKVAGKDLTTGALKKAGNYSRLKALREGFANGGYKAALGAGVVDALGASGTVAAQEETRVTIDPERDFNKEGVALAGAIGFLPGTLLGGFTGAKKAIAGNSAEIYLMNALKENRKDVHSAFKNVTLKNLRDKGTVGKLTKDLNSKLKKLALSKTAEESLKKGQKLKVDLAPERGTLFSIDSKVIANVASAGAEIINLIGPRAGVIRGSKEDLQERITSRISRAFSMPDEAMREKLMDQFTGILKKHNLSAQEFGALYTAEISEAGRTLRAARIDKDLAKKLFEELNEVDKSLFTLGRTTESARNELFQRADRGNFLNFINDNLRALNKTRIGLMTIQLATTVRNTTNGYVRNYIYGLNNLNSGLVRAGMGKVMEAFGDEQAKKAGAFAVKEGVADLQQAKSSVLLKDMVLGIQSEDTAVLVKMFKDKNLGNSEKALELFRELGDIGNSTKIMSSGGNSQIGTHNSRLMRAAAFANILNTYSDNMFKAAIFSREIDKLIRIDAGNQFKKNGIESLSDLVSSGNFRMVDDKALSDAMSQALDFTYQTGRFRGRKGGFNQLAANFIDLSSTQLGSAFVPFPRYMVNAFRFFYEHAPVLGLFDAFGILNKSRMTDRIGKNMTGFMMMGAFYAMREQLGDETTGAYQYKNPFGHGTFDARAALGPFTPYALLGDILYRVGKPGGSLERGYGYRLHDNEKVSENWSSRDLISAFTGGAFGRAGVSLDLMDGLVNTLTKESNLADQTRVNEVTARFLGNYFSTYTVGAGFIKDIYAMVDPDYRLLTDNTDVEFFPYMLKQMTRSFPMEAHADGDGFFQRPAQTSPYKEGGIRNHLPFFRQITGLTPQEERNTAQQELDRLKLDYIEIAPRKLQDPKANRDARQYTGTAVENYLTEYINSPEYRALENDSLKKKMLKLELANIKNEALAYALNSQDWDTSEDILRKNKARFFRLRKLDRDIIERRWRIENPDREDIEMDDYDDLLIIGEQYGIIK